MNNFNIFSELPEGFNRVNNEVDYKLASLTLTQAFADYEYPVPSTPMSHSSNMKYFYELSGYWIDNALKYGTVIANEDFSAVMVLTPMNHRCDLPIYKIKAHLVEHAGEAVGQNMVDIFNYIYKDEKTLTFNDDDIYIEVIAVQTPKQGNKLGSKLIRQLFDECDKSNKNVILFTNTERNASIYTHLGFSVMKKHTVEELNSTTYFMIRKAESK